MSDNRLRKSASTLQGVSRLACDGVLAMSERVEHLHGAITSLSAPLGRGEPKPTRGLTRQVYRSIRGVTRLVAVGSESLLRPLAGSHSPDSKARDILNGILGDHLAATDNPLAIRMGIEHSRAPRGAKTSTESPSASGHLLLMLHGLCMGPGHWQGRAHNHAVELAERSGRDLLYLRYNSGLSIPENGRQLAHQLQAICVEWPTQVQSLSMVGFSMGGLLARSACHYGLLAGHDWPEHLSNIITLGTPHQGSHLEKAGHWLESALDYSPYSAPIGRIGRMRSAGIIDLRDGRVVGDEFAQQSARLPAATRLHAIAATRGKAGPRNNRALGDGLVSIDSALASSVELGAVPGERLIIYNTGHLGLLANRDACEAMADWLV